MPDFLNARIGGKPAREVIGDDEWLQTTFTNTVATRGGALIKKWGRSSAASTAVSIADAIKVRGHNLMCCYEINCLRGAILEGGVVLSSCKATVLSIARQQCYPLPCQTRVPSHVAHIT